MIKLKDTRLHIRASSDQIQRLNRAAEILETPTSEFVRKAIEEKLAKMARLHPELAKKAA